MSALARWLLLALVAAALPAGARWDALGTDQIVVRLKPDAPLAQPGRGRALAAQLSALGGERLRYRRTTGEGAKVMRLRKRLPLAAVEAIARNVARHAEVYQALPDRIALPAMHDDPDDPQLANQWALNATDGIRAPTAWDITTGSSQQVVAIVDTGLLAHADISPARILAGYDFVSDADKPRANDGDGRDLDPTDAGDWLTAEEAATEAYAGCAVADSSWHGTVAAGIIAADTDNAAGIAGVNRNTKILPVRALGKCGGYVSDIADAIRWAAGFAVPEVPDNLTPADVIHLGASIPTAGACDAILQTAINEAAVTANIPVVVAAGNQSGAAGDFSPGNCANVIAVGAVLRDGGIPPYANTGSPIALSAPGGTGTDPSTAVLATSDSGLTTAANDNAYLPRSGTSVAAAHVTGVVSLVQAVNPTLTPAKIRDIVRNTSRAFPASAAAPCTQALCGSGILDARAAVQAALGYGNATPQVAGGAAHSGGVRSDGTLWTWGNNQFGRLGDNSTTTRTNPVLVQLLGSGAFSDGAAISLGSEHSVALRADGTGWAWGNNVLNGRLGDGTTTQRLAAVQVCRSGAGTCATVLTGITHIFSGQQHSLALRNDGTVWTWGDNSNGQLGIGTTSTPSSPLPLQVCASYSGSCSTYLTGVVAVSAGDTHSLALKSDGTVWAWGNNASGRLGDGTSTGPRTVPVQVCATYSSGCVAPLTDVGAIAAGASHSLALKTDGTAWGWGNNLSAQTGAGNTNNPQLTPVQVLSAPGTPLTGVTAISAGASWSMALVSDGTVRTWGLNTTGQLGATPATANYPAQPGVSNVAGIAAGDSHGLALREDGTLYAWGLNTSGQAGTGDTASPLSTPVFVQAAGGGNFTLQLNTSAFIAQFGAPLATVRQSNTVTISNGGGAISIANGDYSIGCTGVFTTAGASIANGQTVCVRVVTSASCATLAAATLTVGADSYPFEVTTEACDTTPAPFVFLSQGSAPLSSTRTSNSVTITGINAPAPISIAGGQYGIGCGGFTSSDGAVSNNASVCVQQAASSANDTVTQATLTVGGVASTFYVTTAPSGGFNASIQVTGGASYSAGLRTDGIAFLWGGNGNGQLGDGTTTSRSSPQRLASASGLRQLSAGFGHVLARRADGTAWSWGYNANGQLGDNTTTARRTPNPIAGLAGVTQVSAGFLHSLALTGDGAVWAWGFNTYGQAGSAAAASQKTPVQVPGLASVTQVVAGNNHSLALDSSGQVWAWGRNDRGQLGTGTIGGASSTPVAVPGLAGVAEIAAGSNADHVLVRKTNGEVWAWGRNDSGQLGNGCALAPENLCADSATPAQVTGISGATMLALGERHAVVLKGDGSVWTWGYNANGQLGDATMTSRSTPLQVGGITATAIGAGASHSLAVRPNGSVATWGFNGHGQIGDGTTGGGGPAQDRTIPVNALGAGCAGSLNLDMSATVFTAQVEVPMNVQRCSNTIALNGIADGTAIAVTGGTGHYQVESGAFTDQPGTLNNGQALTLRQTASASCGTTTVLTVTVGSTPYSFSVTTETCDTSPDAFAFTAQADVPLSSVRVSNPVTITGVNTATPISVSGDASSAYSVGCTTNFVSTPGSVGNGEMVCVRHTSAATVSTLTTTTLTVGSASASFTSTTAPMRPLTVSLSGSGGGTVVSTSPDGAISCPGACGPVDYPPDSTVTLQATPDANSALAGWNIAGCSGATCAVTMTGAIGVVATFELVPPVLQSVKSRKAHAGVGTFDLVVDASAPIGGPVTVEPRAIAAGHRVVFVFDRPITATGAASCVDSAAASCSAAATANGNEVEVVVTGLANNARVTVSLTNVNGLGTNASASLAFATGDVDGTRSVTASDILRAKGRVAAPVDAATAIYDIDLSGTLETADVDAAKANAGAEP